MKKVLLRRKVDLAIIPGGLTIVLQPLEKNIRQQYLLWLITGPFKFTPARKKAPSQNQVLRWVAAICTLSLNFHLWKHWKTEYYKLIVILRWQYHIILKASWEKIYSVLGVLQRSPTPNIFCPSAVNIMCYWRLKIAISFVSQSIIYSCLLYTSDAADE